MKKSKRQKAKQKKPLFRTRVRKLILKLLTLYSEVDELEQESIKNGRQATII